MLTPAKATVCIINPYEHGGGAEWQMSLLIDALVATGRFDVHFLTHFVDARERSRNYRVSRIGDGGPIPRVGYLWDARSLYATLRELDPAVIYQRVACGYTGICAAFSRRRSVPLIWHAAHDTEVAAQVLDPSRNFVRARLEHWAVAFGIRNATRIVVQTRHQAQLLQKNYGRPADAVIANFQPPPTETIDKRGPLTVVWIANFKPWKQPEVFVRLAAALRDRPEVRFIMVGDPGATFGRNQPWQEALMRSIEATPNLEYVGHKSLEEVNLLLARSHIFVNTSTHEGFPNTFIQAWLREAVVVSLTVDPDQVLERQQVGVAAGSEARLFAAVRHLIENPDVRAGYALRGRQHATAHHSLRNTGELIRLIDSCRR